MTVQEKMAQLQAVKSDIKQALIAKGVDMDGVQFTEYAGKISGISSSKMPEYIDCSVPAGGYYQYYLMYSYQQFDSSNESCVYIDSKGVSHTIHRMNAGSYGQSPGFSINLVFDLSMFETEETIKSMSSFKLTFTPASRNPHFNSFKAQALRKF